MTEPKILNYFLTVSTTFFTGQLLLPMLLFSSLKMGISDKCCTYSIHVLERIVFRYIDLSSYIIVCTLYSMSITKILFSASNLLHKYNKIVTQKNQTDYLHEESLVIKLNGMKYDKT